MWVGVIMAMMGRVDAQSPTVQINASQDTDNNCLMDTLVMETNPNNLDSVYVGGSTTGIFFEEGVVPNNPSWDRSTNCLA